MVVKYVGSDGDVRLPRDGRKRPERADNAVKQDFEKSAEVPEGSRRIVLQNQKPYGDRSEEEIAILLEQQRIGGGCDL